jgi:hypothetical protein
MPEQQSQGATALIGRRWCGVLGAGVLVFAIVLVAGWFWSATLRGVVGAPTWLVAACVAGPMVALLLYLGPSRFVGALGLRHTLVHPPLLDWCCSWR